MKTHDPALHEKFPDAHHDTYSKTTFGFWVYLMSDFILFGTLFAAYSVLRQNIFGGPSPEELFHPHFNLFETLLFLICATLAGCGGVSAHRRNKQATLLFFAFTFLIALAFLGMQLHEFSRLIQSGNSWSRNAYLSAYYTVIGTHSLHVILGLLWTPFLLFPVWKEGISHISIRRLTCLRMYWQFLNIIWIFIFALVYLQGGK